MTIKQEPEQFLTPSEVVEFQQLIKETKGIVLTPEEALDQGTRLIMLFEQRQKFEPIPLSYKDIVENTSQKAKNAIK